MKKNILFSIIVLVAVLFIAGCGKKVQDVSGESSFNKYTGVYKYKDVELHVVHFDDDKVLIIAYNKDGDSVANPSGTLEDNKLNDFDFTLEFKDQSVKVKSKDKDSALISGEYKLTGSYGDKAIYKDYVGDLKYFDNSLNGKYENEDGQVLYTVQSEEDKIRLKYTIDDEEDATLILDKQNNGSYTIDFFDTQHEITFSGPDELELSISSKDPEKQNLKKISGTYHKISNNSMVELITLFSN